MNGDERSHADSGRRDGGPANSAMVRRAGQGRGLADLVWLAVCSCALYAGILGLSRHFHYEAPLAERPIVLVLAFFLAAFVLYLIAIPVALRAVQDRRLVCVIFVSALAMRLVLLPSTPIQEVDIYRYLWDGFTSSRGISPYRYSPQQVLEASASTQSGADLARLARHSGQCESMRAILQRVHFPELPTVYPPVSQVVFLAAAITTPSDATLASRVIVMKIWLLLFDMLTLALVVWLLRVTRMPPGLAILYGWCPLLLKEIANSGHLDAIAVLLTTLSVCMVVRLMVPRTGTRVKPFWIAIGASLVLSLAVGAKLYPIVLAPLMTLVFIRRLGWRSAIPVGLFALVTALVLSPMFVPAGHRRSLSAASPVERSDAGTDRTEAGAPSTGLKAFLTRWEMNDFFFLFVIENLKTADVRGEETAWFSIVPESFRESVIGYVPESWVEDRWGAAFLVSRALTLLAFAGVALWALYRGFHTDDASLWLESAFLTLAWFWLLSPTLNPWYWAWVLPLLPWARNRLWWAVAGIVFLYYLRFWFAYHFAFDAVLDTRYNGTAFFDLIVTWIEFGPWFLCLLASWSHRKSRGRAGGAH